MSQRAPEAPAASANAAASQCGTKSRLTRTMAVIADETVTPRASQSPRRAEKRAVAPIRESTASKWASRRGSSLHWGVRDFAPHARAPHAAHRLQVVEPTRQHAQVGVRHPDFMHIARANTVPAMIASGRAAS